MLRDTKLLLSRINKFAFISCVLLGAKEVPIFSTGF